MEGYGLFLVLLVSALLLGFLSVLFALIWVFHYREGLSWDGGSAEFNWHPVLIITGFVFIQGIGACAAPAPEGAGRAPGDPGRAGGEEAWGARARVGLRGEERSMGLEGLDGPAGTGQRTGSCGSCYC